MFIASIYEVRSSKVRIVFTRRLLASYQDGAVLEIEKRMGAQEVL
jgi:hypothetical protein